MDNSATTCPIIEGVRSEALNDIKIMVMLANFVLLVLRICGH